MNRNSQFPVILAAILLSLLFGPGLSAVSATDSGESNIFEEPDDPEEARRVRIWFPVEHPQNCRVEVTIMDDTGLVVRTLLDKLLRAGYYNLYWDKRDDSGKLVPAGEYHYEVDDCGELRTGTITAQYSFWETHSRLTSSEQYPSSELILVIDRDSALVSFEILSRHGSTVAMPFVDSLFPAGEHRISWKPPQLGYGGWFRYRITIDDFVRSGRITPFYPSDSSEGR